MSRRHAQIDSALGDLLVVVDDDAVVGLYFEDHWYPPPATAIGRAVEEEGDPVIGRAAREIREYLAGTRISFDAPLATAGGEFFERVWAMLREIPFGATTTYGALAERLGNRNLAQRVGQAVGRNPISILIPCHRVVGGDGSLTGFAGGLERKRLLLELEEPAHVRSERLF